MEAEIVAAKRKMMKTMVVAGALSGLLLTASPAGAAGAQVTRTQGCFLPLTPDSQGVVHGFYDPEASLMVVQAPNGNAHSSCHGQLPADAPRPAKAIVLRGFPCATSLPAGGITTDSQAVITPSGRVNTTCKFKP